MTEEPLRIAAIGRTIWQRRLAVGIVAVLGLFAGIAYSLARPPVASATALVLLPPSPLTTSGTPTIGIDTQVIIAESSPVLEHAAASAGLQVGPRRLKRQLSVAPLSQDVIQFTVRASTIRDADRLANGVAHSYIRYLTQHLSGSVAELQGEAGLLQHRLKRTRTHIAALSHALAVDRSSPVHRQTNSAQLSSLRNQQQQLTLQLDRVQGQILSVQAANGAQAASTRLLQAAASTTSPSRSTRSLEFGAMGLAVGFLFGSTAVVFRSRRDDLLRFRSELAAAIHAPVLASVGAHSCSTARDWTELLDQVALSPATAWNLQTVLTHLPPRTRRTPTRIHVVSFSDDAPASTIGALLALAAARLAPTAYLVARDDPFVQLRVALSSREGDDTRARLAVLEPNAKDLAVRAARFVVSTTMVDRSDPALPSFADTCVLAVSAGEVTRDDLARLALAFGDNNSRPEGMIVVNPMPNDRTSGALDNGASPPSSTSQTARTAVTDSATRK